MPYEFEIRERDGYLLITASGSIESVNDFAQVSQSMRKMASQSKCRRFLIDERTVAKTIDPHELTLFAEAKIDTPTRMRVAVVYTPENVSKLRWIETIFQNRSLAYRQFSSFDEAERWLMASGARKDRGTIMPTIHLSRIGEDYLHVVAEGSVKSTPDMLNYIETIYDRLAQTGLSRILIDETKCHMHMTFNDLLEVARALNGAKEFESMPKTAVVTSNANHPLFQHIFDSLRGIKVFKDVETAKEWLIS